MISNPVISVIIPTFNRAHYIKSSIDSVLAQEISGVEIIVVDDGSTDGTESILRDYVQKGFVTYYRQKNQGPSSARNTGIERSNGEYICFLDSDDILLADSIRVRLSIHQKHTNLGLVCTDFKKIQIRDERYVYSDNILFDEDFINLKVSDYIKSIDRDVIFFSSKIQYDLLVLRQLVSIGTVMIPRSVFDDIGYFDENLLIAEDIDLWFSILRKYDFAFVSVCTAAYLSHDDNITKNIPLYNDSTINVLQKHLKQCHGIPLPTKKAIVSRIADYYCATGYFYYSKRLYACSRKYFVLALYNNPFLLVHYKYAIIAFFPAPAIDAIRGLKLKISDLLKTLKGWILPEKNC